LKWRTGYGYVTTSGRDRLRMASTSTLRR
jgi:hypothetical protein